jgi:hypothetical protein
MNLTNEEILKRGLLLAEVLQLKETEEHNDKRYKTTWGTKTAYGLYLTAKRIIEQGE